MEVLNIAFYEYEETLTPIACAECGSEHMEHPFDTTFCSHQCYKTFFDFINNHSYDNEPFERQIFAKADDDYDEDANEDFEYDEEEYDDACSCLSYETYLSIYTYLKRGKRTTKLLKNRILVKSSEKYGSLYRTGTV